MKPLAFLRKKADKVFSDYVRQRDADGNGMVRCCTCGKVDHWKKMDCGHYQSRRYLSTRYEETNTGLQCKKCNIFSQGEQVKFRDYLIKRYGEAAVHKIDIKRNNTVKDARLLYEFIIEKYKPKG